ncbi:MAG: ABC transporter permease subunit, partial [Elusimicrobiota bacterium]
PWAYSEPCRRSPGIRRSARTSSIPCRPSPWPWPPRCWPERRWGLLIGYSKDAYHLLNPFIVSVHSLPKIVLMPLIVLWLGIGKVSSVFLGALMASFPIIIATYTGVRCLERDFIVLARSYRASPLMTLRTVVFPGVTPFILSGVRVGINYAMVGILIAEFFASSKGVGYRMILFMSNFEVDAFFVCMAWVAAFSLACTGIVYYVEKKMRAWRPEAFDAGNPP